MSFFGELFRHQQIYALREIAAPSSTEDSDVRRLQEGDDPLSLKSLLCLLCKNPVWKILDSHHHDSDHHWIGELLQLLRGRLFDICVEAVVVRIHRHDRRKILHPDMPHSLRDTEL
jgi:hypothetical protein